MFVVFVGIGESVKRTLSSDIRGDIKCTVVVIITEAGNVLGLQL